MIIDTFKNLKPKRKKCGAYACIVVDPDWIRIQWDPLIRIQEGKNDPQK
jgi:hypothetical protein